MGMCSPCISHGWQRVPDLGRQVCASTSVLMILFSSSAIAISLAFQGLLNLHYAAVFAPACFLGSLLGAPGTQQINCMQLDGLLGRRQQMESIGEWKVARVPVYQIPACLLPSALPASKVGSQ